MKKIKENDIIHISISSINKEKIKNIIEKDIDKYSSISHFVRVSIINLIKKEERETRVDKK